jgi:hypothetical protein
VECYTEETNQDLGKRNQFTVLQQMLQVGVILKPNGSYDWKEFWKTRGF